MPKYLKNTSAMTLVELIVATILVGIIMLGIVAIELAMRRTFSTTSKSAALSMRVSAAMLHFSRNISQAIGDGSSHGVRLEEVTVLPDTCMKFYVRKDTQGSPANYADDVWMRYKHYTSGDSSLTFCDDIGVAGDEDPIVGDPGCNSCSGEYELLRVNRLTYDRVVDPVNLQYYTQVELTAYYDNSGVTNDKVVNPMFTMRTNISYMSHSW